MPKDTITAEIDSSISQGLTIYKDQQTTVDLFDIFQIKDVNGSTITANISKEYDTQTEGTALTGEKIVKVSVHPDGYVRFLSSNGITGRWGAYFQDFFPYSQNITDVTTYGDYYSDPNLFYTTTPDNYKNWTPAPSYYDSYFRGKGPWPDSSNTLDVSVNISDDKSNITTSSNFQSALVRPLVAAQDTSFTLLKNKDNSSIISGKTISKIKQIGVGYKGNTTQSRTHSSSQIDYGVLFTDGTAATVTLSTGTEPYTIPVAGAIPTSGSIEIKVTKQTKELEEFPVTNATRVGAYGDSVIINSDKDSYLVNKTTNQVFRSNNTAVYGKSFTINLPYSGVKPTSSFVNTPLFTADSTGLYVLFRDNSSYSTLNIYKYASGSWAEVTGLFVIGSQINEATRIIKDTNNNFYIFVRNLIYKITSAGVVSVFAGAANQYGYVDATGTAARFGDFVGTPVIDSSNNIYVCDSRITVDNATAVGEYSVRKISPSGVVTTFHKGTNSTETAVPTAGSIQVNVKKTAKNYAQVPITSAVRLGIYGNSIELKSNANGYLIDSDNYNKVFRSFSGTPLFGNSFTIASPVVNKGEFKATELYTTDPDDPTCIYVLFKGTERTTTYSQEIYAAILERNQNEISQINAVRTQLTSRITEIEQDLNVLYYDITLLDTMSNNNTAVAQREQKRQQAFKLQDELRVKKEDLVRANFEYERLTSVLDQKLYSYVIYKYNGSVWSEVTEPFEVTFSNISSILVRSGVYYLLQDVSVYKVTSTGTVSLHANWGTDQSIVSPVIDSSGNIYACEVPYSGVPINNSSIAGPFNVKKINSNGVVSVFYAGTSTCKPTSVAIGTNGNVFITNYAVLNNNSEFSDVFNVNISRVEIISQTQQVTLTNLYATTVWSDNLGNLHTTNAYRRSQTATNVSDFRIKVGKLIDSIYRASPIISYIPYDLPAQGSYKFPYVKLNFSAGKILAWSTKTNTTSQWGIYKLLETGVRAEELLLNSSISSGALRSSVNTNTLNRYKFVSETQSTQVQQFWIPYNASVGDVNAVFSGFLPQGTQYSRPSVANQETWQIQFPTETEALASDLNLPKSVFEFTYESDSIMPAVLPNASVSQTGNVVVIIQPHITVSNTNKFRPRSVALDSNGDVIVVNEAEKPSGNIGQDITFDSLGRVERISQLKQITPTSIYASDIWSNHLGSLYTTTNIRTRRGRGIVDQRLLFKITDNTTSQIAVIDRLSEESALFIPNKTGDLFYYAAESFGAQVGINKITNTEQRSQVISFGAISSTLVYVDPTLLSNYKLVRVKSGDAETGVFTLPYDAPLITFSSIFAGFLPSNTKFFTPTISGQSTWRIEMPQTSLSVSSDFTIPQNPITFSIHSESIEPLELPPPQISNTNGVVVISQPHLAPSSLSQYKLNCSINWTLLPNPRSAPIVDIIASTAQNFLLAYYSDDTHEILVGPKDQLSRGFLLGKTVKKIATGKDHTLVLCTDGSLASYGSNAHGALGLGSSVSGITRPRSVVRGVNGIPRDLKVVDIAAGEFSSYAVTDDGNVYVWGKNDNFGTTNHLGPISSSWLTAVYRPERLLKDTMQTFTNRLSLSSKSLPSGLRIDEEIPTTGRLYGTPNRVGSYLSKIKVDYVDIALVIPDEYKFNFKGTTYVTLPINVIEPPLEVNNSSPNSDPNPNPNLNLNPNPNLNTTTTGSSTSEVELFEVQAPVTALTTASKSINILFSTERAGSSSPQQTYNIKFGGVSVFNNPIEISSTSATTASFSVKLQKTSSLAYKVDSIVTYVYGGNQYTVTNSKSILRSNTVNSVISFVATNSAGINAPIAATRGETLIA